MLVLFTGLSVLGSVVENINISYILPYARCDLELTTTEQGLLNSVSFLGIVVSSHFWGFMADTWGRQKVIRIALLGGFICSILSAGAMNVSVLLVLRFLVGLL